MLGSKIRTRVSQTGAVVTGTTINLAAPGAAVTGHKTFVQGFNKSGAFTEDQIPVLVEKNDGSWQTALASIAGDTSLGTPTSVLTLVTLYESSNADNSAITLTAADPVTVTIAPMGSLFAGICASPISPDTLGYTAGVPSNLIAAFAAGQGAFASGKHSVAMGYGSNSGGYATVVFGVGGASWWDHSIHIAPGYKTNAFGTGHEVLASPGVFARMQQTTNATPAELVCLEDDETPRSAELYCEAGLTRFIATVMAINSAGTVRRVWELKWVVHTTNDYLTTALLGTVTKTDIYSSDGGASAWDCDVNIYSGGTQACAIEVTGAAATNIAWAARVDAVMMGIYAP